MKIYLISILAAASVAASAVNLSDITLWTGSGDNRMGLVIDFNDGQSPRSYVWGYRWSGTATGEDALRAIVAADPLLESDITVFSFGASLSAVKYLPSGPTWRHNQTEDFVVGRYWSYWGSTDGSSSWTFASVGMSTRALTDGAVDGWAFSNVNYAEVAPTTPIPAVPEPASIVVTAVGLGALSRRRKR